MASDLTAFSLQPNSLDPLRGPSVQIQSLKRIRTNCRRAGEGEVEGQDGVEGECDDGRQEHGHHRVGGEVLRSEEVGEPHGEGRARDQDDPEEGEQSGSRIIDAGGAQAFHGFEVVHRGIEKRAVGRVSGELQAGIGFGEPFQRGGGRRTAVTLRQAGPFLGDEVVSVLPEQGSDLCPERFGKGGGVVVERLKVAGFLDDVRAGLVVIVPGVGDDEGEEDAVDGPEGVEEWPSHVVVLAQEVGVDRLAHDEKSKSCQQDRPEDADHGLQEGGAMEGDPLLGGEVLWHCGITS